LIQACQIAAAIIGRDRPSVDVSRHRLGVGFRREAARSDPRRVNTVVDPKATIRQSPLGRGSSPMVTLLAVEIMRLLGSGSAFKHQSPKIGKRSVARSSKLDLRPSTLSRLSELHPLAWIHRSLACREPRQPVVPARFDIAPLGVWGDLHLVFGFSNRYQLGFAFHEGLGGPRCKRVQPQGTWAFARTPTRSGGHQQQTTRGELALSAQESI